MLGVGGWHSGCNPVSLLMGGRKTTFAWTASPNIDEARAVLAKPDVATSGLRKVFKRAKKRAERRCHEFSAATWSVYDTVPRSNAGLLALLAVWKEEHEGLMAEEEIALVGTIEAFAKGRTLAA